MIKVSIGGMSVPIEKVSEGWINQMIAEARKHGAAVCVQVSVQEPAAHVLLATPGCGPSGGGGREANFKERKILDVWVKRGLATGTFSPGELRAFLNELARLT